jgi:hypothetical protein
MSRSTTSTPPPSTRRAPRSSACWRRWWARRLRRALDLYFDRHDGQACTIEDWLKVFEDATGRDLSQFKRWYEQAGTPRVRVTEDWEGGPLPPDAAPVRAADARPAEEAPMTIPLALGLIGANGQEVAPTQVVVWTTTGNHARVRRARRAPGSLAPARLLGPRGAGARARARRARASSGARHRSLRAVGGRAAAGAAGGVRP